MEQAFPSSRLRGSDLPAAHGFRRLPSPASGTCSPRPGLPAELDQSISPRRPEDSRLRTAGATRLAAARPHHRALRESREHLCDRHGFAYDARPWLDFTVADI